MTTRALTIRISPELYDWLIERSKSEQRSFNSTVVRILREKQNQYEEGQEISVHNPSVYVEKEGVDISLTEASNGDIDYSTPMPLDIESIRTDYDKQRRSELIEHYRQFAGDTSFPAQVRARYKKLAEDPVYREQEHEHNRKNQHSSQLIYRVVPYTKSD
jgi:hypothetical protein